MLSRLAVAFLDSFGPRRLAPIGFALAVAEEHPELPGRAVVLTSMTLTRALERRVHGAIARSLGDTLARRVADREAVAGAHG